MASSIRPERSWAFSTWSIVAAFGTYFCMYGFRKPFTAGTYDDASFLGIGLKTVLVSAQLLGYTASKFIGIRVIAEMKPERRVWAILSLISLAELALLGFGLVPPPWNFAFLFLNGLPLGMVFGLVLGFLEGRRQSEALVAGLCASFILADGVAKSVGTLLLGYGVGRYWMPFAAGLVFVVPLLIFVAMLSRIPPPTTLDIDLRSERSPMTRLERGEFFAKYAVGLILLILIYLLVSILRGIRADFAPEIWNGLGHTGQPGIFTWSEMLVMFGVVAVSGSTFLFRDNRRAFFAGMTATLAGFALVGIAALGQSFGLGGFPFMVLVGLGLYLPYVALHTTIFERLIAMSRDRANVGYLLYLADAFGYLGYVAVMVGRSVFGSGPDFLGFFRTISLVVSVVGLVVAALAWAYFATKRSEPARVEPDLSPAVLETQGSLG